MQRHELAVLQQAEPAWIPCRLTWAGTWPLSRPVVRLRKKMSGESANDRSVKFFWKVYAGMGGQVSICIVVTGCRGAN